MSDTKKDITSVLDYSKKIKETQSLSTLTPGEHTFEQSNEIFPVNSDFSQEFTTDPSPDPLKDLLSNQDIASDTNSITDLVPDQLSDQLTDQGTDQVLDQVKNYSEALSIGKPNVQPAYPFNLTITGFLSTTEKERLLELLSKHSIGIEEKDLKIQFQQGHVLLPRISEYAGILLIQALRGSKALFKLFPTEVHQADTPIQNLNERTSSSTNPSGHPTEHPAESLPLTQSSHLSQLLNPIVLDTLLASATLKAKVVEASHSSEYQEILEALKRELKYKAYHKGARGILNFSVVLTPLSSPSYYRLTATGTGVK